MASTRKTTIPLSLPLKTRIKLSIISTLTDASLHINGTFFNRRFIDFFHIKASANPNPVDGVKSTDVTVDSSRKLWFRIYVPTKSSTKDHIHLPVIVFFHGGGFVYLSADNYAYDAFCRRLTPNVPAVVVSVDYRLAPENRYPASYEDGFDVLKFLDEDKGIRKLLPGNADLSRCFLAGDSAGGNLAHNVAVKACQSKFRQLKVIGVVAIQPFFGGEERTEAEIRLEGTPLVSIKRTDWMWRALLPPEQGLNRDHQVINVSGPNAIDLSRLEFPAALVVIGGHDALQDWQMRYYEWLKRSGKQAYLVEYPNMCHAFYIFPEVTESGKLISDVADFIQKCLNVLNDGQLNNE